MPSLNIWLTGLIAIAIQQSLVYATPLPQGAVCVTCVVPCATCEGQWGEWGPWSDCTFQYGVWGKTRERSCIGSNCQGARDEAIQCSPPTTTTCPPPVWGAWGAWGGCSATCGGGVQSRARQCIRVAGQMLDCTGASTEQRSCNTQACCTWGGWSAWTACSVTCGDGVSIRTRQCSCGTGCTGESLQQQACSYAACPQQCDSSPNCVVCCEVCVTCVDPCTTGSCNSGSSIPTIPTIGSGSIPTIGSGSIPTIGSGIPTITTRSISTIGTSDGIPIIGSGSVPMITTRSIPQIGDSTVPQIDDTYDGVPVIGSNSYDVPFGQGARYNPYWRQKRNARRQAAHKRAVKLSE